MFDFPQGLGDLGTKLPGNPLATAQAIAMLTAIRTFVATHEFGRLFGHGTLTATMRAAPRDQIGLALGAWGAVQTTAAGAAIALGGVIRDVMLLAPDGAQGAAPYLPVFGLEVGLLLLALILALPLRRQDIDTGLRTTTSLPTGSPAGPDGLADTRP